MAVAEESLGPRFGGPDMAIDRTLADQTARRIQRLVGVFRLMLALGLLGLALLERDPPLLAARYPDWFAIIALAYAAFAAGSLALPWVSASVDESLTPLRLPVDIVAVTLLMHTGGGISSGIGGLLVVLIGAASLSLKGEQAMLAAAIGALAVLGEQALSAYLGLSSANAFIPAGVLGAIIFVIAATASPLARRLQESEALARQRGIDLANLAQLNDYVIQNLRESIVVVDAGSELDRASRCIARMRQFEPRDVETGPRTGRLTGDRHGRRIDETGQIELGRKLVVIRRSTAVQAHIAEPRPGFGVEHVVFERRRQVPARIVRE